MSATTASPTNRAASHIQWDSTWWQARSYGCIQPVIKTGGVHQVDLDFRFTKVQLTSMFTEIFCESTPIRDVSLLINFSQEIASTDEITWHLPDSKKTSESQCFKFNMLWALCMNLTIFEPNILQDSSWVPHVGPRSSWMILEDSASLLPFFIALLGIGLRTFRHRFATMAMTAHYGTLWHYDQRMSCDSCGFVVGVVEIGYDFWDKKPDWTKQN